MEFFSLVLVIVILIVLLNFKDKTSKQLKELEEKLFDIKQRLAKMQVEERKVLQPKPADIKQDEVPEKAADTDPMPQGPLDYWETGFKVIPEEKLPVSAHPDEVESDTETVIPAAIQAHSTGIDIPQHPGENPSFKPSPVVPPKPGFFERNPDVEKFIGENLISKIGIGILVLAIGFFVKYAIDNEWIGPVGRVGIGLLCGAVLVGFAHKLRNGYKAFSSVLIGGGMAVFYFTIALAYHNFHLFSQTSSFIIMVVITLFSVVLSLLYNRQELAVISLIGGFAAPFMVSNGSGNYQSLFTYLIVLNAGLLIIAYNKAWRLLNLLCFIFTVIIFAIWLASVEDGQLLSYRNGFIFATVFYLMYFFINIANNIKENKKFIASDFGILLANTSLYFGAGLYCIVNMGVPQYKGLYSVAMGMFNLAFSFLLFRNKKVDTNIVYLLIGITLTFVSLTAPLQLQGNYITLFWASECVMLYWLYRKSSIPIFKISSAIIWIAMLISLLMDWGNVYSNSSLAVPIVFNKAFVTSVYAAIATYLLYYLLVKKTAVQDKLWLTPNVFRAVAIILLFTGGALEINFQFVYYYPTIAFNQLFLLMYSLIFVNIAIMFSRKFLLAFLPDKIRILVLAACLFFYFVMVQTTYDIQEITFQKSQNASLFFAHWMIALLVGVVLFQLIVMLKNDKDRYNKSGTWTWVVCAVITAWLSIEFHLVVNAIFYSAANPLAALETVYVKAVLPILWGLCSFGFMWLGMKHKYKPLRIISLTLFSITLGKLFLFDISNIPVSGKIAAFFCLGILLLVVSFMYQRLKKIISDDEDMSV